MIGTIWVLYAGNWVQAEWDAMKVGVRLPLIDNAWFNLASFEAYCFELYDPA